MEVNEVGSVLCSAQRRFDTIAGTQMHNPLNTEYALIINGPREAVDGLFLEEGGGTPDQPITMSSADLEQVVNFLEVAPGIEIDEGARRQPICIERWHAASDGLSTLPRHGEVERVIRFSSPLNFFGILVWARMIQARHPSVSLRLDAVEFGDRSAWTASDGEVFEVQGEISPHNPSDVSWMRDLMTQAGPQLPNGLRLYLRVADGGYHLAYKAFEIFQTLFYESENLGQRQFVWDGRPALASILNWDDQCANLDPAYSSYKANICCCPDDDDECYCGAGDDIVMWIPKRGPGIQPGYLVESAERYLEALASRFEALKFYLYASHLNSFCSPMVCADGEGSILTRLPEDSPLHESLRAHSWLMP